MNVQRMRSILIIAFSILWITCKRPVDPEQGLLAPNVNDVKDSAIFVDGINGQDEITDAAGNIEPRGTADQPLKTISAGIAKAALEGKTHVLISRGNYDGTVYMVNGISLHGGYDASNGWSHDLSNTTTITSKLIPGQSTVALEAEDISTRTVVAYLTLVAQDNPGPGGSSYGVRGIHAGGLVLAYNHIQAGKGGDGSNGLGGKSQLKASPGGNGQCSCGNRYASAGGDGGLDDDPSLAGGAGGHSGFQGDINGAAGLNAPGNQESYGQGGTGEFKGLRFAVRGIKGEPGSPVLTYGFGGIFPTETERDVFGADGSGGTPGNHGHGGGGGGGTADHYDAWQMNCGGTGGGAGGKGGGAGQPGKGGGGSVAVLLFRSSGSILQNNLLETQGGGHGGTGGDGGSGGEGGNAGDFRSTLMLPCTTFPIQLAFGASGGAGSNGTAGGGGAGGPSYGIYLIDGTVVETGNQFTIAAGGLGGGSPNLATDAQGAQGPSGSMNN